MPSYKVSNVSSGTHNYPSCDPNAFFDWERWEADNGARSESNRSWHSRDDDAMSIDGGSQSDSRSIPDLVYGSSGTPSESGNPSSPGSPGSSSLDPYPPHLTYGKEQPGLYVQRQQELLPYPSHLEQYAPLPVAIPFDDYHHHKSSKKSAKVSSSKRPHGSSDAPSKSKSGAQRGRRSGPLCNKDEVAEVRALGACFRCKITKVSCGAELNCDKCVKHADSKSGNYTSSVPLSQQICIRRTFTQCGHAFEKIQDCQPPAPQKKSRHENAMQWDVVFDPNDPDGQALPLSVIEHVWMSNDGSMYEPSVEYLLDRNRVPHPHDLQRWVGHQITREGSSNFQSALDNLLESLYHRERHYHHKNPLLESVREMRCMFKLWSTNSFCYYKMPEDVLLELPYSVQAELKRIATSRMRSLEHDIQRQLDRLLEPSSVKGLKDLEKITVWVCLMQCILLYRELLTMPEINTAGFTHDPYSDTSAYGRFRLATSGIYNGLVVMCDAYFSSKIDKILEKCARQEGFSGHNIGNISRFVDRVLDGRSYFHQCLDLSDGSADQILFALLVRTKNKKAKHYK